MMSNNFYPSPSNPTNAQKRDVFENTAPIYAFKDSPLIRKAKPYSDQDLANAGINPKYRFKNFSGYLTLPIGNKDFMSQNNINGINIYNYYTQYQANGSNLWTTPTFIDNTAISQAQLLYQGPDGVGHLVVPIYNSNYAPTYFSTIDSNGNYIPQS